MMPVMTGNVGCSGMWIGAFHRLAFVAKMKYVHNNVNRASFGPWVGPMFHLRFSTVVSVQEHNFLMVGSLA